MGGGVTDYCNRPPEASARPHVGGMINPSIEAIVGLKPDLIVLSMEGNMRADFVRLTAFGAQVFVTNPRKSRTCPRQSNRCAGRNERKNGGEVNYGTAGGR